MSSATAQSGTLHAEVRKLVESLKRVTDPHTTLNRGLWGLGGAVSKDSITPDLRLAEVART